MSKIKKPAATEDTENRIDNTESNSVRSSKQSVSSVVTRNQQLEAQLKRALADYQNLERRIEEERKILSQLSCAILVEKFLPVLDNLENAQKHLNDQGLQIVIGQFKDILTQEGVEEIQAEGARFDPHLHEATEVIQGENDGVIAKVIRKGYKIDNKVIRPVQVVVERKTDSGQARMTTQVNKEEKEELKDE